MAVLAYDSCRMILALVAQFRWVCIEWIQDRTETASWAGESSIPATVMLLSVLIEKYRNATHEWWKAGREGLWDSRGSCLSSEE